MFIRREMRQWVLLEVPYKAFDAGSRERVLIITRECFSWRRLIRHRITYFSLMSGSLKSSEYCGLRDAWAYAEGTMSMCLK